MDQGGKERTVSTASSASSVTEFVNEVFEESELELSKIVSINVSNNSERPCDQEPKDLEDFANSTESRDLIPRGFRKMYLAALVVLLFPICMGVTATYSATATEDMKKAHSSIHPSQDEISWIGSLMAIGALIGGTAGVIIPKGTISLVVLAALLVSGTTSSSYEDDYSSQFPSEVKPSLKKLLIERVFEPSSLEDNLKRIREAGLKRTPMRGLNKLPPGFVGVRGKKSEKAKVKDPFPGFLGVRGKKTFYRESTSYEPASTNMDVSIPTYIHKEYFKLKSDTRH